MSNPFNGPASRLWVRWKSLSLPWRKQRLAGFDLNGNTFWEFKDTVRSNRWRRIARQPRNINYADIKISPQWHQWLRHTRPEAPTMGEQQADVQRQIQIKELALLADQRWASQQSYLQEPPRSAGSAEPGGQRSEETTERDNQHSPWRKQQDVRDNWQGGKWQPQSWAPRENN